MDTPERTPKPVTRRKHSAAFKRKLLRLCEQPGASIKQKLKEKLLRGLNLQQVLCLHLIVYLLNLAIQLSEVFVRHHREQVLADFIELDGELTYPDPLNEFVEGTLDLIRVVVRQRDRNGFLFDINL
ncbi:hypothetical protein [Polaromonas sp.]|uniref:hypothetical protein n=1 Tax=Polaromonas sp. TaxID=1869339 RepID=UPI0027313A01|nr:hypothetical protein [Polaromonas sp.]MDP1887347.1 hypothetical protein [Polaromonas sp.]